MDQNGKQFSKISGYLEKKGKKKMITSYKKYWFVLEGGLLLYYRSKDDYETISPCKGSINLGPPCIIKPCQSTSGGFQIQTRIATVTLRAENRDEQNKWMQAIMSEIDPHKNYQRMSHFRYSMENVSQSKEHINTINSTPESESYHNSTEDIIHRLQKMGAQSYNPMCSINKIATIRQKERSPLPDISSDKLSNRDSKSSEHIYERISSEFKDLLLNEDPLVDQKYKKAMTLPSKSVNTVCIKTEENRPKTFIIENDTYAISIQQKYKEDINKQKDDINKQKEDINKPSKNKCKLKLKHTRSFFSKRGSKEDSVIVENDTYASVDKEKVDKNDMDELRDHNENNLLLEEENAYSIPHFFDNPKQVIYTEELAEYSEPFYKTDEDTKIIDEKDKKKSKSQMKQKDEEKVNKLNKRPSFIRRVWKKKEKKKDKNEEKDINKNVENIDDEELYETVPPSTVEKVCLTDSTAVQMLSELQNILEHKMPLLMEKISTDLHSPTSSNRPEIVNETSNEKIEEELIHQIPQKTEEAPQLPPKTIKVEIHASAQNTSSHKPTVLPPKKKKKEIVKSLDEILDELDSQESDTQTHKNTVKKLIKKFSEPEFFEQEVVLRNRKNDVFKSEIDSDELSRLLEELAKVTNAPILTPGVTSSLNGTHLPDVELSKLLPAKQRRYSEPDYDIPRPHKSLSIPPKKESASENVIGSTRFFGPILKPSDMIIQTGRHTFETSTQLSSITPDSLETNIDLNVDSLSANVLEEEMSPSPHKYFEYVGRKTAPFPHTASLLENEEIPSPHIYYKFEETQSKLPEISSSQENEEIRSPYQYFNFIDKENFEDIDESSPHQYFKFVDRKLYHKNKCHSATEKKTDDFVIENEIYSAPRSISMNFELIREKSLSYEQDDEVFVDSLEVCKNEVSTEF